MLTSCPSQLSCFCVQLQTKTVHTVYSANSFFRQRISTMAAMANIIHLATFKKNRSTVQDVIICLKKSRITCMVNAKKEKKLRPYDIFLMCH